MTDLEPLAPSAALPMYLDARKDELTDATRRGQKYRIRAFVAWCDENGIENLNDLSGRDLYAYRIWRREGHYSTADDEEPEELETVTLRGQLATLRAFLRFCGTVDAVPEELFTKVPLPSVEHGDDVSERTLKPDRAREIIDYLGRYSWASRDHIVMLLTWHTGCRIGALQALDLRDLDLDAERTNAEGPAIRFVHRPGGGTPLKNDQKSERWNTVSDRVADALRDYVGGPRKTVTDDEGRAPLVTTPQGRISKSAVRYTFYKVTRPCWRGEACPHDRDPVECDATHTDYYSQCPSVRSPHDARSGRVTAYRLDDVPRVVVSDRMDASEKVLDKHYDRRSNRQKAEQRREHLPDD